MYLSKVHLSWSSTKNPYLQHKALWQLFPGREQEQRSFLFRIEQVKKGEGAIALMLSQEQPQQPQVIEDSEVVAVKALNLNLSQGQAMRFRLRANPVKSIKDASKGEVEKNCKRYTRSVRVPLIHEDQQHAWLERKLAQIASIKSLNIQQELPLNFRKQKESRSGKIQPVLYEGVLIVDNPDKLLQLIIDGIGPAKAFGCGLLSLAAA